MKRQWTTIPPGSVPRRPPCDVLLGWWIRARDWTYGIAGFRHPTRWHIHVRKGRGRTLVADLREPVALLWALALEIDERMETRTGEVVCRACGGRAEIIVDVRGVGRPVWSVAQVTQHSLRLHGIDVDPDDTCYYIPRNYAVATQICPCDGPTRPDTVQLHHVVRDLADLPRPCFEWPDAWLAYLDWLDDGGRTTPPWIAEHATIDVIPDWIARWWRAFREWTHAGKEPDAEALAVDLAALLPELRAREEAKRAARRLPLIIDETGDLVMAPWRGESQIIDRTMIADVVAAIRQGGRRGVQMSTMHPRDLDDLLAGWIPSSIRIGRLHLDVDARRAAGGHVLRAYFTRRTRHELDVIVREGRELATLSRPDGVAGITGVLLSVRHDVVAGGWMTEIEFRRARTVVGVDGEAIRVFDLLP